MTQAKGDAANRPGKPKGARKSANATMTTKAKTTVNPRKKAAALAGKLAPPTKKMAAKPPVVAKPKRGPTAFARGTPAKKSAGEAAVIQQRRQNMMTIIADQVKKLKKPVVRGADKSSPVVEKLVPFAGFAPISSAADIERLVKARPSFSQDNSFEE